MDKKGTKTCVSSREQRYKPLRMGQTAPRGTREVARARATHREQAVPGADREQPCYAHRGRPRQARRAARDAHHARASTPRPRAGYAAREPTGACWGRAAPGHHVGLPWAGRASRRVSSRGRAARAGRVRRGPASAGNARKPGRRTAAQGGPARRG
jgi:hypothetical protein